MSFNNEVFMTRSIFDSETDLQYMNARYYDASSGRFISQDSYRGSLANPQTQHLYSYTSNNPVNFIDPTGHKQMNDGGGELGSVASKGAAASAFSGASNRSSVASAVKNLSNSIHTTQLIYLGLKNTNDYKSGQDNADTLDHEYGHYLQLNDFGLRKYTIFIAIPSATSDGSDPGYYNNPWEADADSRVGIRRYVQTDEIMEFARKYIKIIRYLP